MIVSLYVVMLKLSMLFTMQLNSHEKLIEAMVSVKFLCM